MDDIYKALVDAIIPRTMELAELYGDVMYYGALDLKTDEFLILSLNEFYVPLAEATAELLELFAEMLWMRNTSEGQAFLSLSPSEIFLLLTRVDKIGDNFANLPLRFQDNSALVLTISNFLTRLTMMGYYSEWYGYGSTRLETPNKRTLKFRPLSWRQVGYPGPAFSYLDEVKLYYSRREERGL